MRLLSPLWLLALLALPPLIVLSVRSARRGPVRLSPSRRTLFILCRSAAVVLLVLGLAGLQLTHFTDRLALLFVLDQSRSVTDADRAQGLAVIQAVRDKLKPGDAATLIRFGADAEREDLEPGVPVSADGGAVDGSASDIGGALQFALAQAPAGAAARIVLLSDGRENRGSAAAAAAVAHSLGARIYPMVIGARAAQTGTAAATEVAVEEVRAPARARQNEPMEVTVMVRSRTETRARVTLLRDGVPVATREGTLAPGENAVQFTGTFPERGPHAWDGLVEAPGDGIPQNNHARLTVEVTGTPQILYVAKKGTESPSLLAALKAQGITAVTTDPTGLPGGLAGYLPYDALIMDNVPGYGISNDKMEAIAHYVRDAGGGLLMVGGDTSFGAGGYYKTPIERILPVDMDVKSQLDLPRLSLLLVVDTSGSMGGPVATGETKLDVVKSAALSAIETLNPFDQVGLLAFDADWHWAVPMTDAGDTQKIMAQLASLTPGGGTIMFPALQEAARVLMAEKSPLRHLIVLTDGLTNAGDFQALVTALQRQKITVSTVAVGEDADATLLANLARWGGGRAYATNDPRDVPRILLTETSLLSRSLLVEKGFFPRVMSAGESVRGVPLAEMPGLKGFVLTYPKPGAEVELSALTDAPLLATWRYGLGRTAAFTSDMRGRWSAGLLAWDQYPRFVSQLVRWLERPSDSDVLHPAVEIAHGAGTIRVDAYDALGAFVDGLAMTAIVVDPQGVRNEVSVTQTGPGMYEAAFPAASVGDYTVTLAAHDHDAALAPRSLGVSVPYSDEYRMLDVDAAFLGRLASITGGGMLSGPDDASGIAAILRREPGLNVAGDSDWVIFLVAALALFFSDILLRRLRLPEGFRSRLAARVAGIRRAPGPSFEQLTGMVKRAREEERSKLRNKIAEAGEGKNMDSELAAYLYIARLRSRKSSEEPPKE